MESAAELAVAAEARQGRTHTFAHTHTIRARRCSARFLEARFFFSGLHFLRRRWALAEVCGSGSTGPTPWLPVLRNLPIVRLMHIKNRKRPPRSTPNHQAVPFHLINPHPVYLPVYGSLPAGYCCPSSLVCSLPICPLLLVAGKLHCPVPLPALLPSLSPAVGPVLSEVSVCLPSILTNNPSLSIPNNANYYL